MDAPAESSRPRPPYRLHPYLAAAALPLGMWLGNLAEEPRIGEVVATFATALGVAAAADLGARLVIRRAACRWLVTLLGVLAVLAYGHAFEVMAPLRPMHRWLVPAWLAAIGSAAVAVLLLRRTRLVEGAARLAAVGAVIFLAVEVAWVLPVLKAWMTSRAGASPTAVCREGGAPSSPADLPDIYYIILDGYARADVLRRIHGFDNTPFLDALRERGFYVADRARANYAQTRLSLPSSLSMCYLPSVPLGDAYAPHHEEFRRLRKQSAVVARLKQAGYSYRYVGSIHYPVDALADEELFPDGHDGGYFRAYLATTLFEPVLHRLKILDPCADRIALDEYQWASIARPKADERPMYVFAHIVCPHGPYLYDRDGPRPDPVDDDEGTSADYVPQVQYVNRRVLELLDGIDRTSGRGAIVLLQADHGSDMLGLPDEPSEEQLFERMSILSAYRVPPEVRRLLYPEITPVNSFRAVLSGLLGDDLPRLEDRAFYSSYETPLRFVEVR